MVSTALVIGASGLLGGHLLELRPEAIGTYRRRPRARLRQLDLGRPESCRSVLNGLAPLSEVVLATNAPSLEWCETCPEEARRELVEDVGSFLSILRDASPGATVTFVSTDYVFDGATGAYDESAATHPLQAYGHCKRDAERIVLSSGLPSWVVRTSFLYGEDRWQPARPASFPLSLLDRARRGEATAVSTGLRFSPTEVRSLAAAVWALAKQPPGGIIHAAGSPAVTRLDVAQATLSEWGLERWAGLRVVRPDSEGRLPGQAVRRPRDSSLDSRRLAEALGLALPTLEEGLRAVHARLEERT